MRVCQRRFRLPGQTRVKEEEPTSEMAGDVVPLCARRFTPLPVARQAEVLSALATDVAGEDNEGKGRMGRQDWLSRAQKGRGLGKQCATQQDLLPCRPIERHLPRPEREGTYSLHRCM